MKDLIAGFSKQLRVALEIATANNFIPNQSVKVNNILICGLGGSGIGGTITSNLLKSTLPVPILSHKDYGLPGFVDENTLVICCSYSGDTEETLDSFALAQKKNAPRFVITSGGKLKREAERNDVPHILIPSGMPPRACLGYSLVQLLHVLGVYFPSYTLLDKIENAASIIEANQQEIIAEAEIFAQKMANHLPIIYTESSLEGVGIRFRQQLNENSKILCWNHVIPEMNHNELVGWASPHAAKAVVFLRSNFEHKRSSFRIDIVEKVVKKYTENVFHLYPKGKNLLEQSLYLIHLCDWISYFISDIRKVDATEVAVIDDLKSQLEQFQ